MILRNILNVVTLLFSLLSGRSFQVFGRAKYVFFYMVSPSYKLCPFLRSWSTETGGRGREEH